MIANPVKAPAKSNQPFAVTIPTVTCVFNAKHKYNQLHQSQKLDCARSWQYMVFSKLNGPSSMLYDLTVAYLSSAAILR